MKLFRHLGLMIAVFRCAAMVLALLTAAAGTEKGSNRGNNQMQQGTGLGTGFGNTVNPQCNNQNNTGPGQGDRLESGDLENNPAGNMTAPLEKPEWDPANMTALKSTGWHGYRPGNLNITNIPPPIGWEPANMTSENQSLQSHGDGNMTMPAPPRQGRLADSQDQQAAADTRNSEDRLNTELIAWLKAHGMS